MSRHHRENLLAKDIICREDLFYVAADEEEVDHLICDVPNSIVVDLEATGISQLERLEDLEALRYLP
jgi:hypothetical protein